ncbi:MAG: phosphoribosylglycinamide formyltransferase, partial [Hyphomicrobiales bacterium]|nr:phosphoribosylglycinamide formyltransferase [Hyphomicrobiales bacterium]
MKRRVAVLISGRGTNMTALIAAAKPGRYPAEISLVVSNRPRAPGLATAIEAGIATTIVDHKAHSTKDSFEDTITAALESADIELVC